MKPTHLAILVLLLTAALAESALTQEDFTINIQEKIISTKPQDIEARFTLTTKKEVTAFDVKIRIIPPKGVVLDSEPETTFDTLTAKKTKSWIWTVHAEKEALYDFTNAFEIVSWDNTTKLQVNAPQETKNKTITITGTTDPTQEVCIKHEFKGIFSDKALCNTLILINGKEAGYADNNGDFETEHELQEGENTITITAKDPGSNTETQTLTITYTPPTTTEKSIETIKENWQITAAAIGASMVAISALYFWVKKGLHKTKTTVYQDMEQKVQESHQQVEKRLKEQQLKELFEKEKKFILSIQATGGAATLPDITKYRQEIVKKVITTDDAFQQFIQERVDYLVSHHVFDLHTLLERENYKELIVNQNPLFKDPMIVQAIMNMVYGIYKQELMNAIKTEYEKKRIQLRKTIAEMLQAGKTFQDTKYYLISQKLSPEQADDFIEEYKRSI